MEARRRSSVASSLGGGITATALNLSLEARRELTIALLWSLPRDDIIAMNTNLSRLLQKDILGSLPPEVAVLILTQLELGDILRCRLVSRDWAKLYDDQGLWASLCAISTPPIRPRPTTWADLTLHQQLSHHPPSPRTLNDDEASFEANMEYLSLQDIGGGLDVINSQGGLGGGGGVDSFSMAGGVRGMVWERGGYDTPTYTGPTTSSSSSSLSSSRWMPKFFSRNKRRRMSDISITPSISRRTIPYLDIPSHLPGVASLPQVNYKHLYLVRDMLARRIRGGEIMSSTLAASIDNQRRSTHRQVRPRTIDAISSIQAGGLYGHTQTIYALQLISRQMSIAPTVSHSPNSHASYSEMGQSHDLIPPVSTRDIPPSSWLGGADLPNRNSTSGRDWLLSASRDHTLRLWQLSTTHPRVVKVFSNGHKGSVLCLSVTTVTSTQAKQGSSTSRADGNRIVAVSGGSDGRLCLWDIENGRGEPEKVIKAHTDSILCLKADDERVVTSSKDRMIKVFDVQTLEELLVIDCKENEGLHRGAINAIGLTKEYILSASGDKTLRVWSIHTGDLLASVDAGTRGIASLDFSPPPPHSHPALKGIIAIGSSDASIKVYHLISHIPGVDIVDALDMVPPLRDLSLNDMLSNDEMGSEDDGESVVELVGYQAGMDDTGAELRLEAAGQCWASCECPARANTSDLTLCTRCFNRGHTELVRSVQFGDGIIISGSYDSTVKVWDRTTGRLLRNLTGPHSGRVFSVVGDHMRIISSGLNASISIWDFSEGLDTAFVEP